jgi:Beta-lactamase enzyme family/Carboxypeptidase regulatory-like domain/PEGA domain
VLASGVGWLKVVALAAGALAAGGAGLWAATPLASTGQLVDGAGRPVAGAAVSAATTLLAPAARAISDAQGRYRVGDRRWPSGPPVLAVSAAGFLPASTTGGRLVLHRWPRLTGHVVDDAGSPVPGAVVVVARSGAVLTVAMTDLDGRFAVVLPAAGGAFTATAVSDEHDPGSHDVAIGVDQAASVQLALPRQFGVLHVESDPAGQAPEVDGAAAPDCPATPCDVEVQVGAHRVTFGGDLFEPWQSDVQVDQGATAGVSATLVRKTGTLTVAAPSGGELTVDGQAVSGSAWSGQVPTGQHVAGFRSDATWPFAQQYGVSWNQTTHATLAPAGVAGAGDAAGFTAGLRAYLAAQGGGLSSGVYLEELGSGATIGVGDTTGLEAASVIKVPEAIYLLREVDAGQVKLDDPVTLEAGDFMGGTGSLDGTAQPGDQYSYRQLLTLLIQQSDNTAWLALRRVLGDSSINGYAASIGAGDCDQVSDWCSARSAGHMLAQLARGRLVSAASTRLLLGLLETTIFNDRINWYLPHVTIAHKVGMDGSVRNDCGVVFMSSDPFAICVFTTDDDIDQGTQVIRDIARAAAWHYSH